ncbi:peptidylprolyl isomerase [Bacteroides fragilis]
MKPKVSDKELDEANARLDSIANDIRSDKFTFDQAASALSQDKDTRNNHGLMQNPQNQTAKFEMQDLPQEIAKVVDKMNIGEISKAFTMVNPKDGKEVCAIVKLKSRINGHKATITDDYQNLKEIVLDKRREEALQKWIVENRSIHTYVLIRHGSVAILNIRGGLKKTDPILICLDSIKKINSKAGIDFS